jgi:peptide/nickel transport system substrate-binding protein
MSKKSGNDNEVFGPGLSAIHKSITRRRFLGQSIALSAAGLVSTSLLDASLSPSQAQTPIPGGVLKAAFSADPAGFDPQRGPSGMSHVVIEQVYSTLMALDPDAKPYPELAESHEISDDGLIYTFKLRQGVTFHNGDELTAEDVKFSFDRLRAKDSGYSYGAQVETIASVDVVDKHTVKFTLSKRTGPFLTYMAFPGSSIVPKKSGRGGTRPQCKSDRQRSLQVCELRAKTSHPV